MRGQDGNARRCAVEAGNQPLVIGLHRGRLPSAIAALVHEYDRGFEAVMPIGDEQLLGHHGVLDLPDHCASPDHPKPVRGAVVVLHVDGRRRSGGRSSRSGPRPAGRRCRACRSGRRCSVRAHQAQPVRFRFGQRALVRQDPRRGVRKVQQRDEAGLDPPLSIDFILPMVGVDRRFGVLDQNSLRDPSLVVVAAASA